MHLVLVHGKKKVKRKMKDKPKLIRTLICLSIFSSSVLFGMDNKQDRQSLADCVVSNIEYYKSDPQLIDTKNFYEPYKNESYNVLVDTIIYRCDHLFAIAFIVIEIKDKEKIRCDARALMCFRLKLDDVFEIYPLTEYSAIGYESNNEAVNVLKECFLHNLNKKKDRFGNKFLYNVGDNKFWNKSLYFKKVKTLYYFQTYLGKYNEYIELKYPNCKSPN
jgi:hypothetical protein